MKNKAIIKESFNYITLDYKDYQPIKVLEKILNHLKNFKATHFELYVNRDYECSIEDIDFTPIKITFETDEQRILREERETTEKLKLQQEAEQRKEVYEREQLQRLKEKYEN